MLCTMALARCVGVASQAAFPRPNWSQALKSRTRSRAVAADAAGGLHRVAARTTAMPITSARIRGMAFTTGMWPAPCSWLITARGDRDVRGSGIDRLPAGHAPQAVPRVQRPAASVSLGVAGGPDPQQTAA